MSLRDDFFASVGELRKEPHQLHNGKTVYVGEVGGDEWLDVESETQRARFTRLDRKDPFLEARLIVRSVTDENNIPIFKLPVLNGDRDDEKAVIAEYEAELQRIMKLPRRIFQPLRDKVNEVNFADDASFEVLKKKYANAALNGSSSSPETPETST